MFILFEHASGYSLFNVKQFEELGAQLESVDASVRDFGKFNALVHLHAYAPFEDIEDALEECLAITDGLLPPLLLSFLEKNLLGTNKKSVTLGVGDPKLGQAISSQFPIVKCLHTDAVPEVLRGIRYHFTKYCKKISGKAEFSAQLGLGHRFARAKVQFNANRVDNMIMQAIALVDQTGKDINTFVMRIREWYSYHFPELYKLVPDQYLYCQCASYIGERSTFTEDKVAHLAEILSDEEKAKEIFEASRNSIGMEVTAVDLLNVNVFCARVISLMEYRTNMLSYLKNRMQSCAPSLSAVVGEQVGARLISQAGSLNNLAKYPASTIQILGAEKALFRALKKKGNTPKYGLLYHSPFIGRAANKDKGKISRFLANKCAIASRMDCFAEIPLSVYGEHLKAQIEERLRLFETGIRPRKNVDVMREAIAEAKEQEASMLQKLKVKTRKLDDFKENEASAVEVVGADSEDVDFSKDSLHTNMNGLKKKRKRKEKLRNESGSEDINTSPSIMESERKRKKKKSNIDA